MTEQMVIEKISKEELSSHEIVKLAAEGSLKLTDELKWLLIKKSISSIELFAPTDEMVKYVILHGYSFQLKRFPKRIYESLKPDEVDKILSDCHCSFNFFEKSPIIENIKINDEMVKVIAKYPYFFQYKKFEKYINEKTLWISIRNYRKEDDFYFHKFNNLTDSMWEYLSEHFLDEVLRYAPEKIPEKLQYECVKDKYLNSEALKYFNEGPVVKYFERYSKIKEPLKSNLVYKIKEALIAVPNYHNEIIKSYPNLYCCIKEQNKELDELAVQLDPNNLQYVKKQTDDVCMIAYNKDKNVIKYIKKPSKRLLKKLGINPTKDLNQFPEKYYLVYANEKLFGEDDLSFFKVIPGEEMKNFMNSEFQLSFGEIIDDELRKTRTCFKYKAISEDEYNVLAKLNLLDVCSGAWCFELDGEDYLLD